MLLPIAINVVISTGAYFLVRNLIPHLKDMFLKADISGIDMSKTEKIKM